MIRKEQDINLRRQAILRSAIDAEVASITSSDSADHEDLMQHPHEIVEQEAEQIFRGKKARELRESENPAKYSHIYGAKRDAISSDSLDNNPPSPRAPLPIRQNFMRESEQHFQSMEMPTGQRPTNAPSPRSGNVVNSITCCSIFCK